MLPAQRVDATPSNALIRQYFPGRSDLFDRPRSKPSQGSVPADLTLASDLAFVFNASRVRLECCVDPLKLTNQVELLPNCTFFAKYRSANTERNPSHALFMLLNCYEIL